MRLLPSPCVRWLQLLGFATLLAQEALADDAAQRERGGKIYAEKCLMCHQPTGLGAPPLFPPLAESEWVSGGRTRLIKVLCEGLTDRSR